MLKKAVSKAAASEEARSMLRYVELLSDARTKLADFFSILPHGNAAAGMNILPCQPPYLLTDDERHHISIVFGETKPLQWRHLDTDLAELVSHHACLSKTRRDRIDGHASWSEFLGQSFRVLFQRPFAVKINSRTGKT